MAARQGSPNFNIAEVSDLCGIKAHVLRYWETEFPQLKPEKNASGQRVYRQKDVDVILRLKQLLYEDEYTISGARKRLEEDLRDARRGQLPLELDLRQAELLGLLMKVKRQLGALKEQLAKEIPAEAEGGETA